MKTLVLGGTRYMGVHLVNELISAGHEVTIATRGNTPDSYGNKVRRLKIDRKDPDSLRDAFQGKSYDVTVDNIAYSSNEVRFLLDSLQTSKYVLTSTVSVYSPHFHENMCETEIDTKTLPLKWCDFVDFSTYDEVKRQAEAAAFQAYSHIPSAAVRFPYIFGEDDYTNRLYFYVENIFYERPMHIDNLTARISFIDSVEAGQFLFHAATAPVFGPMNAGSNGTVSLEEIIAYTEKRMSKKAILSDTGATGTMNGVPSFGLDTSIAVKTGFKFRDINDWVYPLIDLWVKQLEQINSLYSQNIGKC